MPERVETTHVMMERKLVLYQRGDRSSVWQCRYKVDGQWHRATTKEYDLGPAKARAERLMIEAEIRKHANLPVVTRKFRDIAKYAATRMQDELAAGGGKVVFRDYIAAIEAYMLPYLGKYSMTGIDIGVIDEFYAWREKRTGKPATRSTVMTYNGALSRVFKEAVDRGFLSPAKVPPLVAKGKKSERRPAFTLEEARKLRNGFDGWIELARDDRSKELRQLLRDYVIVLLDTGARPGKELLNVKWKQLIFKRQITATETDEPEPREPHEQEGEPERITTFKSSNTLEMTVTGKTGTRQIIARNESVKAILRIAQRNYGHKPKVNEPFKEVIAKHGNDFVFRTKDKAGPTSFQKLFATYLEHTGLLIDPKSEQERVFYSLRHTYATFELTHERTPIRTLAHQMGTSVLMIEKHYDHLIISDAIDQLRGTETERLLNGHDSVVTRSITVKTVRRGDGSRPSTKARPDR
jgi:integrase